jgi:phage terminase small subunit
MQIKNYKKAIITFLESKGNSADIDELLLDNLIYNMELLETVKVQLKERGAIEDSSWGRKICAEFTVYQILTKEIKNDFQTLGISPATRAKLKLEETEKEDSFDQVFNKR